MELSGSHILLTGASSGIGAALARQLAEAGATLGLVARRADRLEEVVTDCRVHSPDSRFWPVDLSDLADAEAVVHEAWDAFGGLDALINNAAMPMRRPVAELTADAVDEVMNLNFASPMRMGQAALPRMLERGSGLIVNVSSMGGRIPIAHEAAYCAAKYALAGWSENSALDLAQDPVDIKLILPGPIDTEIWDVPDNVETVYEGEMVSADECAAGIMEAMVDDGFEYYVPPVFPGDIDAKNLAIQKTTDCDAFIDLIAEVAAAAGDD
ncbi:MAG: SDR family NAD(P)-dependent oxidoreductase [Acidimicrobiia bacterium]